MECMRCWAFDDDGWFYNCVLNSRKMNVPSLFVDDWLEKWVWEIHYSSGTIDTSCWSTSLSSKVLAQAFLSLVSKLRKYDESWWRLVLVAWMSYKGYELKVLFLGATESFSMLRVGLWGKSWWRIGFSQSTKTQWLWSFGIVMTGLVSWRVSTGSEVFLTKS